MHILSLIQQRKSGEPLSDEQMQWLVSAVVDGEVPDYQLATMLTVMCYEKLTGPETVSMTRSFVASGDSLSWEGIGRPVVDKHSTGGVGDKVTLGLAPLVASAGLAMPKMSGRGLGHTGGTIDKLESIPGFRTALGMDEFRSILSTVGCAIAGQTAHMVPADKIFYAMRDATDNVRELGLVAASVMSKKIAAGAPHIVLDVKCGSGAFFLDEQEARAFARLAMDIGTPLGRKVACVITDMDQPLGRAVGNRIEVLEILRLLEGSPDYPDLREVIVALGSVELVLTGMFGDPETAGEYLHGLIDNGDVKSKFREWVRAQGGQLSRLPADESELQGVQQVSLKADKPGVIEGMDCAEIGNAARRCGAGRLEKDDVIVPDSGLLCDVSIGDRVEAGDELVRFFIGNEQFEERDEILANLREAIHINDGEPVPARRTVIDILLP
ncbi:thymidine phosphorylase [bacterium]|nr:thymidine phosphorylase [bacterium]